MAKKQEQPTKILEREYIIPLRKEWLKVPEYKRANKAVKAIKQFIVRHMKIYDRDLKKVKVDPILNNELWFRGIRKPPAKIKVKAIKFDNETVKVEIVELPEHIKFAKLREERKKLEEKKKAEKEKKVKEKVKEEPEKKSKEEGKEEEEQKEKKESVREAGLKQAEQVAKQVKHLTEGGKAKEVKVHRKALTK